MGPLQLLFRRVSRPRRGRRLLLLACVRQVRVLWRERGDYLLTAGLAAIVASAALHQLGLAFALLVLVLLFRVVTPAQLVAGTLRPLWLSVLLLAVLWSGVVLAQADWGVLGEFPLAERVVRLLFPSVVSDFVASVLPWSGHACFGAGLLLLLSLARRSLCDAPMPARCAAGAARVAALAA